MAKKFPKCLLLLNQHVGNPRGRLYVLADENTFLYCSPFAEGKGFVQLLLLKHSECQNQQKFNNDNLNNGPSGF